MTYEFSVYLVFQILIIPFIFATNWILNTNTNTNTNEDILYFFCMRNMSILADIIKMYK